MNDYRQIIDEKDYCHEAELLTQEYSKTPSISFQAELDFIHKWLAAETTAPLLVLGEPQSGKKTLLCEFLRSSKQAHPNWLHLCHFSSITPHYSHILYRIMIELRNQFKVEQRVDLNEEKLRRYFKYWLEVASDHIDKQFLGYARQEVPKVVIVIEGIDECLDSKGNLVENEFWLPHQIPKNVKLILTTKSLKEKQAAQATVLRHYLSQEKREKIVGRLEEKARLLSASCPHLSLYSLHIISCMLKIKPNFHFTSNSIQEIVQEYIGTVSTNGLTCEQIRSILYILTLARKGLRAKWVLKIVSVSQEKWGLFLRFFSFFIVEAGSHYIICSKSARGIIRSLVDCRGEKEKTYRQSISHSIRNEAAHLRELEEMVYQLYESESFSELKEVIGRVENFAMLYTPLSKDLLCQSWVKLEQLEQYDPVFEYNKAIEAYKSHYYPKEEDLYKIIFQISMFFKEYAEFESARTPSFRHPLIKGETDQLQQIGIYDELKSLAMIGKSKVYKLKPLEKFTAQPKKADSQETKRERQAEESKGVDELATKRKLTGKSRLKERKPVGKARESDISVSDPQRPETSSSKEEEGQPLQAQASLNIEQLNVSIQANQEKFRSFFTSSMREYLENYFAPLKKCAIKEKELSFESEESENEEEEREMRVVEVQKLKQALLEKKFREYLEESYHKTGEEVSFYYYKQWIWLQFPWICQTVRNVYSQMIRECLPGSIHFMSPLTEFKLVREVLKIARSAKESKMNIFTEKKIEVLPLRYSPQKMEQLESSRNSNPNQDESRVSRTKRTGQEAGHSKTALNLNNIDEIISNERQLEQSFREKGRQVSRGLKGQSSMPNFNMFVTEAAQKGKMLPYLGKSKFAKQPRNPPGEKENTDSPKDYTLVVRKFNEIKHENDMLAQKIEEMRRLSSIQLSKTREEHDRIVCHIRSIEEKRALLEKNFHQQSLLQKKLEVIIKICDLNKMYGSESEYLSTYLASLKQMIQLEEARVSDVKLRIAELLEAGKGEIRELRRRRKQLKTIKEEHDRMYLNLASESTNPHYRSMPLEEIQEELREIETTFKTKSKKERSKMEHCLSSQDYELIQQKLGLIFGDALNEAKVKDFSDKCEKKKELLLKNSELSQSLKREKQCLATLHEKLENAQQVSLNEKRLNTTNELLEKKKELSRLRQRSHLLEQALETLSVKQ